MFFLAWLWPCFDQIELSTTLLLQILYFDIWCRLGFFLLNFLLLSLSVFPFSLLPWFLLPWPYKAREIYVTSQNCVSHLSDTDVKRGMGMWCLCISYHPTCIYSPAIAKPPRALASDCGSHTHFSQHSPGTWTLRGMGQSGPGSMTSKLQRGTQAICPLWHIHWYLQLGKKVWPFR